MATVEGRSNFRFLSKYVNWVLRFEVICRSQVLVLKDAIVVAGEHALGMKKPIKT